MMHFSSEIPGLILRFLKIGPIKKAGTSCGNVLECINAFLPEGCGKTPSCPDCTIRTSVNETYKNGTLITRRPAVITRKNGDSDETIRLFVSTRKDSGVVLLQLEFCAVV